MMKSAKALEKEKLYRENELALIKDNNESEIARVKAESDQQIAYYQNLYSEAMQETKKVIEDMEAQQKNYLKLLSKHNYEAHYPKPQRLENHQQRNPKSFYIQVLGCRGAGKSTFLNRIFKTLKLRII